ncbi:response regulator transcription factor [Paenibacillus wulumuqiensis]|uniref:response regulator transcription factor n=1 Tax=Paenibacillus wulumuqiensis TaxID=1567107 RepID=UPI0006196DCD|nr:response regulator transcription factor [Paenibacillus wulumuqiensis]
MFKVMIVDDEPAIREGLKTIVDWDAIGFEVAETAANGREALQKYERIRPDLMIMDIRMPGMSGLEVIEQLRQDKLRQAHVLILSGYADFEYARRALGYGVDGYLLKPVDEQEMEEELRRVHRTLEQERRVNVRRSEPVPVHEVVEQMLLSSSGKEQNKAETELQLDWDRYQIILLELREGPGRPSEGLARQFRRLSDWWTDDPKNIVFRAGSYLGILTGREADRDSLLQLRQRLLAQEPEGYQVYLAAGEATGDKSLIHDSYEQAESLMNRRFWAGESGILQMEPAPVEPEDEVTVPLAGEWADRLYYAVDIRSLNAVERVMQELITACRSASLSERDTKSLCSHVLSLALSRLPGSIAGSGPAVQKCLSLIPELYAMSTAGQIIRLVLQQIGELLESMDGGSHESVMKQMTDFIRRHYSDNLKLEMLAEIFNYNSAYLGKMFKTYTGESFNHFLDQVRLDNAKEMLAQGMKVHKVAAQVGYANVDYFHSKFKKYTGISPSAYREQMGQG